MNSKGGGEGLKICNLTLHLKQGCQASAFGDFNCNRSLVFRRLSFRKISTRDKFPDRAFLTSED